MQKSLKQIKQNEHTHTCRHTYIYTHDTLKILNKFPTIVLSLLKGIYMTDVVVVGGGGGDGKKISKLDNKIEKPASTFCISAPKFEPPIPNSSSYTSLIYS